MNDILRATLIIFVYGALQFFLGCSYGKVHGAVDNASKLDYNIEDPNLDFYFDRDVP